MMALLMGLKSISASELYSLVRTGAVTVFDVNPTQSWQQAHVPGARHLDPLSYRESDLPRDKAAPLVFYCSNFMCRKAPNAARRAKELGYSDVRVLSAGISGWLGAGLPTEGGEAAAVASA